MMYHQTGLLPSPPLHPPSVLSLGLVHKRHPQSEGVSSADIFFCNLRTFFGQGGRGFIQMRTSSLFGEKTLEFSKFVVCPNGKDGGSLASAVKWGWGSRSIFSRFCTDVFYGRSLREVQISDDTWGGCLLKPSEYRHMEGGGLAKSLFNFYSGLKSSIYGLFSSIYGICEGKGLAENVRIPSYRGAEV